MATLSSPVADSRAAYRRGWARGWAILPRPNVAQWADANRVLTRETSKEHGLWRTARTPFLREPMEALSEDSPVIEVTLCFGTQLGKTEVGNNFVGNVVAEGRGSILVVQHTSVMGVRWSRQRFDMMSESTPAVGNRIAPVRSRDASNAVALKRYPGGYLIVGHAESASSLSSLPARNTFLDEVDDYPLDTCGQGDPIKLAEARTDSFGRRRKNLRVSSPKKQLGASHIWRLYLLSDRSRYLVPCPHCNGIQALEIEGLLPGNEYLCEHCGHGIPHRAKTQMLHDGAWKADVPERSATHRGFRLPTLYAADGLGPTWADLYQEQAQAQGDPVATKTFVSTRGARAYESTEGKVEPAALQACREEWRMRDIPPACLPLVAGVDCQGNRFEVQILGFGRGATSRDPQIYVIDYAVIPGSPLDPAAWVQLDDYLSRPLRNAYGVEQLPRVIAVDSGNWTREVYAECWERKAKGWVAVKGSSTDSAPLHSPPKPHMLSYRGGLIKHGAVHYMVGTHAAKDTILGRLAVIPSQAPAARWWHLPADLPEAWFAHMTSERRDPETGRWEKVTTGARNECPDIAAYAWAIAHLPTTLRLGTRTERDWAKEEAVLHPVMSDLFAAPVPTAGPVPRAPVSRETPAARPPASRSPSPLHGFGKEGWGI